MRDPKPWYRKSSKAWYAQIGGRQVRLGETERAAKTKLKELLKKPEQVTSEPLKLLFDRYLAYCEQNLAKDTFEKNYYHLKRFSAKIGNMKAGSLKPFHVQRIIDGPSDEGGYGGTSDTYRHTAITVIKGALRWAKKQGYLSENPLSEMEKPTPTVREFFLPGDQWATVLAAIKDKPFHDYVAFMLTSGARPQEIRKIEARHFEPEKRRIVFAIKESKGKKRQRVIYLDDTAFEIVTRLVKEHPTGCIFRDTLGGEWNKDSVKCRFQRLQKKLKLKGLCSTSLRHSFAHWKLTTGTDSLIVSKLLGHVDGRMLATRYGHIEQSGELMLAATNSVIPPLVVLPNSPTQQA